MTSYAKVTFIGDFFVLSTTVEVRNPPKKDADTDSDYLDSIITDANYHLISYYGWDVLSHSTVDIEVEIDEFPHILT